MLAQHHRQGARFYANILSKATRRRRYFLLIKIIRTVSKQCFAKFPRRCWQHFMSPLLPQACQLSSDLLFHFFSWQRLPSQMTLGFSIMAGGRIRNQANDNIVYLMTVPCYLLINQGFHTVLSFSRHCLQFFQSVRQADILKEKNKETP